MPVPLRPRVIALALAIVCISIALYICIQGAVMLYECYQILQWMEGVTG